MDPKQGAQRGQCEAEAPLLSNLQVARGASREAEQIDHVARRATGDEEVLRGEESRPVVPLLRAHSVFASVWQRTHESGVPEGGHLRAT